MKPSLVEHAYLVRIIKFRKEQDIWNSFLASITKVPDMPPNPLAYLHVRAGPRKAEIQSTYGLLPKKEGGYECGVKHFIDNPDPATRDAKPKVHETPMYPKIVKALFSKSLATTYVHLKTNIRPALFSNPGDITCGVLIPLHPEYALINRIFAGDGWSYRRAYDHGEGTRQLSGVESLEEIPGLKGSGKNWTEILARLRWFSPTEVPNIQAPSLLVCSTSNTIVYLQAILVTLIRAFDIKFCLLRNFKHNATIPIITYNTHAPDAENAMEERVLFTGTESIVEGLVKQFVTTLPGEPGILAPLLKKIRFLQGIYFIKINREPPDNFDSFVKQRPKESNLNQFYLESFRALLDLVHARNEAVKVEEFDEYYRTLIANFSDKDAPDYELKLINYGYHGDFSRSPESHNTRINPQYPFKIL